MNTLRPALRAIGAGCLAGIFTLGLDELLAYLTLGFAVPVAPLHLVAYAAVGAAVGLVYGAARRWVPAGWTVFAVAAAGVYAPAIFERVQNALGYRIGPTLAIAVAAFAVAGFGLWILALGRVAGQRHQVLAPLLGAVGAAIGLAVNRNLVDYPLEPKAVVLDATVLTATLALAWAGRTCGARRALAVTAALMLSALAVFFARSQRPASPAPATAGQGPPNLVLVIIDTLRQDVFQSVVRTTDEGRAFRQALGGSAWFSHAIAAAPWTAPSVGSIMTGLYPQEHGFVAAPAQDPSRPLRPLARTVLTLAETLHPHGYLTEAIGTNPLLHPVSGIARGFDRYEILSGPTAKLPLLTALARLGWLQKDYYQPASSIRRRLRSRLDRITAAGRPVFLWLHLMDPHDPLTRHLGLASDPAAAGLDDLRRLYRDEARYALRELTSMLELLRAHGLWHNTALVITADHGEMFPADSHDSGYRSPADNQPMLYGHGHAMYGELVRVPLVIRPPGGLPKTRRVKALTSHVDLHDTMLDLLGIEGGRIGGERISLAPWLAHEPPRPRPPERDHALIGANQLGPKQRALRTRRLKLIDYPDSRRPAELYEITTDPAERRNLAGLEKVRLARVQRRLESFWGQLGEAPAASPTELDLETLERLRALGYVQ